MTPPEFSPLRFISTWLHRDTPDDASPSESSGPVDSSGVSSFGLNSVPDTRQYNPKNIFLIPKLFSFSPSSPAATQTGTTGPSSTKWRKSDTGQLIVDLFLSVESLDGNLYGLPVNDGKEGCRYSEIVSKKDYDAGNETCKNKFDAGTEADMHVETRPVAGKTYSELYELWVTYHPHDKLPGRLGIRIGGFSLTNPLNKNAAGPLHVQRNNPFKSGKDFRAVLNHTYDTPLGQSVPSSDKPGRLVMHPVGGLYGEGPGISFDISKNMLKAWGLKEQQFTDLDLVPFQLPLDIDQLLRFFPLPRTHNPEFILANGCSDKLPGAEYIHPNFINGLPTLIQWLNPKSMDGEIRFRNTSIPLGDRGHINLGDKGINRIKISGDKTKTVVAIELGDIPSLRIDQGGIILAAKGLRTGTMTLTLPPIEEISREFGLLDQQKYEDAKSDCERKAALQKKAEQKANDEDRNLTEVLDELEAEADAEDKTPKKDHSAFIGRLIGNIRIDGIFADELSFEHPDRGLKAEIKDAEIKFVTIQGKQTTLTGLGASHLSLKDSSTKSEFSTGKSSINEIKITQQNGGPEIAVTGPVDSSAVTFTRNNDVIQIDKTIVGGLQLDLTQRGKLRVALQNVESSGAVNYKNNQEGYEIKTSGNGSASSFELNYNKSLDGDKMSAKIDFSGKVQDFHASNPDLDLTMSNTQLEAGNLEVNVDFPPLGSDDKPKYRFTMGVDVQETTLENGHSKLAQWGKSTLTNSRIELESGEKGLTAAVAGLLKLNIDKVKIPLIELATKGFSIEGLIKDIVIDGYGSLFISPEQIRLDKSLTSETSVQLKINGDLENIIFRGDPPLRKSETQGILSGKSEMRIQRAKVEVGDLTNFEFIRPDPQAGQKADLQELNINRISITGIEASAEIGLKSPFGPLVGKFPRIGNLPDPTKNSEIRLESLDTKNGPEGRTTQITNLLIQLFELGGKNQEVQFKLPSLALTPKLITTGGPIELKAYLVDPNLGGFKIELKDKNPSNHDTHPATKYK